MKITCLSLLYSDSSCLLRQLYLPSVFPLGCTWHGLVTYSYFSRFFFFFHNNIPLRILTKSLAHTGQNLNVSFSPNPNQDSTVNLEASRDPFHSYAKTKAGCQKLWMPSKTWWAVQMISTACLEIPSLHMYMLGCDSLATEFPDMNLITVATWSHF